MPKGLKKGQTERRSWEIGSLEVRKDGEAIKIVGHAAVFNKLSERIMFFREKVAPGAFKKTIQEADVRALLNHDPNFVLGRNKAGTLSLEEDAVGLKVEISPPDTQWARDLTESIKRGDISQMSFGFRVVNDSWAVQDGEDVRTLEEVELFDVSPVTFPAYPQTDVGVRGKLGETDLSAINEIVAKISRGETPSDADRVTMAETRSAISNFLEQEPGQEPHSESQEEKDEVTRQADARGRELDLIETE